MAVPAVPVATALYSFALVPDNPKPCRHLAEPDTLLQARHLAEPDLEGEAC